MSDGIDIFSPNASNKNPVPGKISKKFDSINSVKLSAAV
jgi:hypothetical protein